MTINDSIFINADKATVWNLVTDVDNWDKIISGIEKVEILERPNAKSMEGLKWRETRIMFGKTATEVMWVTDVKEQESYNVRAENHGSIYLSGYRLKEKDNGTELEFNFTGTPQSLGAKIMGFLLTPLFKGATKKALAQDLQDIKKAAEGKTAD